MARKIKRRAVRPARVPLSNEELIARLQGEKPKLLTATVSEAAFNAVVDNLLAESPSAERQHFYCRTCGEYHEKNTSTLPRNEATRYETKG
jgi:hypothetical protein